MKKMIPLIAILFCTAASYANPTPDAALEMLMKGNERFVAGKSIHPRNTPDRRQLASLKIRGTMPMQRFSAVRTPECR